METTLRVVICAAPGPFDGACGEAAEPGDIYCQPHRDAHDDMADQWDRDRGAYEPAVRTGEDEIEYAVEGE